MHVPTLDITARAIPPDSVAPMNHCSEEQPAGCFGELLAKPTESAPQTGESRDEAAGDEPVEAAQTDAEAVSEEINAPADENQPVAELEEQPDEPKDEHEGDQVVVSIAVASALNVLPAVVAEPIAAELPVEEAVVQAATPIEIVDSVPLQPVPHASRVTPALQPAPVTARANEPVRVAAEPVVSVPERLEVTPITPIVPQSSAPLLPTKETADVPHAPRSAEQAAPAQLPAVSALDEAINGLDEKDSQPQAEQQPAEAADEAPAPEPQPTLNPTSSVVDVLAPLAAAESSSTERSASNEQKEVIAVTDAADQPTAKTETSPQPPPVATPRLPAEVLGIGPSTSTPVSDPAPVRLLQRVARAFAVAKPDSGEVTLRLSPPELGSLRLEVRVHQGAMVARVEAETSTARNILVDNLPALRDRLAEQGVRIERFDIDLMQRHTGGAFDRSAQQQNNEPAAPPQPQPSRTAAASESPRPRTHSPTPIDSKRLNVIV